MSKIINPLILAVILAVSFAARLQAQSPNVHELQLYPGIETAPLGLQPWLVNEGQSYVFTVISPPTFGTLVGEDYLPSPELWESGADRLTLEITKWASPPELHTILISLVESQKDSLPVADFEECFDAACLPPGWSITDPLHNIGLDASTPLSGTRSLVAWLSSQNDAFVSQGVPFGGGTSNGNASGGTRVGPPTDDGGFSVVVPGTVTIATLGNIKIRVTYPGGPTGYFMQAVASGNCTICETPLRPIPAETPIAFNIWAGLETLGPPSDRSTNQYFPAAGLRFMVQPEGQPATVDWLDGTFDNQVLTLGLRDPAGLDGFEATFDDFVTWTETNSYSPTGGIADGFENGQATTAWVLDGPSQVLNKGTISGLNGLVIDLEDLSTVNGLLDATLIDNSPQAATALTALLRVRSENLGLGDGDMLHVFGAAAFDALAGGSHVGLLLNRVGGEYRVRARALDDQGVWQQTPWHPLTGNEHDLTVRWQASTGPLDSNGTLHMWSEGAPAGEKLGIDNHTQVVESVAFGALDAVFVNSLIEHGELHLDDIASFSDN